VKYVVFYEGASDMEKARLHFPAHKERYARFVADGTLLMIGTFGNPAEGAMGVFTTREAAEEFVKGDPFILNGVVTEWRLSGWNEVLDTQT
jgi:uncharacterized protein YciI